MENFEEVLNKHNFKLDDKKQLEAFMNVVGAYMGLQDQIREYENISRGIFFNDIELIREITKAD